MTAPRIDQLLVERIRNGDAAAWKDFIAAYEGRLIAFADSRLRDRGTAEDVVQDSFIGFLNALPNYDATTPLDAFLFAITAHKITDVLRKRGRRPALHDSNSSGEDSDAPVPDSRARVASSMARSVERKKSEEQLIAGVLRPVIDDCRQRGNYVRLKCLELLFVRGVPNKDAAGILGITEQDVANHKQHLVSKLKAEAARLHVTLDSRILSNL